MAVGTQERLAGRQALPLLHTLQWVAEPCQFCFLPPSRRHNDRASPLPEGEGPRSHPDVSTEALGSRCSLSRPFSTNSTELESQGLAPSHLGGRQTLQGTDERSWAPEDPPHCGSAGGNWWGHRLAQSVPGPGPADELPWG